MKSPEYYRGREQTYLKHFFLERYLERVAYNIGYTADEFVYVDGFSGPWKSADESLNDTSFMIAIEKLRQVRDGLAKSRKYPRFRCLFIESDSTAFRALQAAIGGASDLNVQAINGEFEQSIPEILRFVGSSFSLVFIDPTGWTGFGLKQIRPILQLRGEVLVNFMFDYINRFLEDERPEIAASFDELFGGPDWEAAVRAGTRREEAIIDLYRERMRDAGHFPHVTSTRVLKPTQDRAYFYLVYGTRHPKGLIEFRGVEKKAVEEQERVRLTAKQESRIERTGQTELWAASSVRSVGPPSFDEERALQQEAARERLRTVIGSRGIAKYEHVLASLLEIPLVWESDVKQMILELYDAGELELQGLRPGERTPKHHHTLVAKRDAPPLLGQKVRS